MSLTTYWIIFVAALMLDRPFKIIRWPLSFGIIVADAVFYKTGDVWRTIAISLPLLIVFMVIHRTIRNTREKRI